MSAPKLQFKEHATYQIFVDHQNGTQGAEQSEMLLRSLHAFMSPHYKKKHTRKVSWELSAKKDKVDFLITTDALDSQLFLENKIVNSYPSAYIKKVPDPLDEFEHPQHLVVAEMKLSRHYIFPTAEVNDDMFKSLLNSISNLGESEKVFIQIVMHPLDNSWQGTAYGHYRNFLLNGAHPEIRTKSTKVGDMAFAPFKAIYKSAFNLNFDGGTDGKPNHTPIEKQKIKQVERKINRHGFLVAIRILCYSPVKDMASKRINIITNSFVEYGDTNQIVRDVPDFVLKDKAKEKRKMQYANEIYLKTKYREISGNRNNIMTDSELAGLVRLGNENTVIPEFLINAIKTSKIPQDVQDRSGCPLGLGMYRGERVPVFFPLRHLDDSVHPMMVTGPVGSGKTTVINGYLVQRAVRGDGVIIIDTQGDQSKNFLQMLPRDQWHRVVWLNFGDVNYPVPLQLLELPSQGENYQSDEMPLEVLEAMAEDDLITLFKKMFGKNFGNATEYLTRNNITAVLRERGSFIEMMRMLLDREYRQQVVPRLQRSAPFAYMFWNNFDTNLSDGQRTQMVMPSINKVGRFIQDRIILPMTVQDQTYRFRELMDEQKIVIITIPKSIFVGDKYSFMATLLLMKIWSATLTRQNVPRSQRPRYILSLDEAEDLLTETISDMLVQMRKLNGQMVFGFQYLKQLQTPKYRHIWDALNGQRPHIIALSPGEDDAESYESVFKGHYTKNELKVLPRHHGVVRLSVNGNLQTPFTMCVMLNLFEMNDELRLHDEAVIPMFQYNSRTVYHPKTRRQLEKIIEERCGNLIRNIQQQLPEDENDLEGADVDWSEFEGGGGANASA